MPEYQYGQFSPQHFARIRKGIELFNQQMYWECHEDLEHHWLEDTQDAARNVYWAVIQVAASLIHYRDGKIAGARGLISKAKEKFQRCEDLKVETDVLYNGLNWQAFKNLAMQVPKEPELDDFKELYNFRFTYQGEEI